MNSDFRVGKIFHSLGGSPFRYKRKAGRATRIDVWPWSMIQILEKNERAVAWAQNTSTEQLFYSVIFIETDAVSVVSS